MKALRGNLHKAVSLLLKKKATNALFKKKNQTPILSNTQAGNDLKDFLISWVFVFSYFFFLDRITDAWNRSPSPSQPFWEPEARNTVMLFPNVGREGLEDQGAET